MSAASVNVNSGAAAAAAVANPGAVSAALFTTVAAASAAGAGAAVLASDSKQQIDAKANANASGVKAEAVSVPVLPAGEVTVRPSGKRGHADHGWLNSYHTFSFAGYQDSRFSNFHSLRVINEDRVSGGEGFGTHPHSNFEIFSYVVGGALSHRDSMGNKEIIRRGEVQFTSAGSGMMHSEFNAHQTEPVHFLQMWVKPHYKAMNIKPAYQTRNFTDADKSGKLCLIVAPEAGYGSANSVVGGPADVQPKGSVTHAEVSGSGAPTPAWIHNDIRVYASILSPGQKLTHNVAAGREAYVHVIQDVTSFDAEANLTGLKLNGQRLGSGDGAFLKAAKSQADSAFSLALEGAGEKGAKVEFLIFDIKKDA